MTATIAAPPRLDHIVDAAENDEGNPVGGTRRRQVTTTTVSATAVAVAGAFIGLSHLSDNSFLTHLATGRLILRTGSIPSHDPYSFTAHGAPWTVQSWLASVLYAAAERLAGGVGVIFVQAAVTVTLALVLWRLTRTATSLVSRQVTVLAILVTTAWQWSSRPMMIGYLFLALTILVVDEDRSPWWLIPMGWLWVNSHGSFPLALVYLGARIIGARIGGGWDRRLFRYAAFSAAGMVAGALSPAGPKLLVFPIELLSNQQSLSHVTEWMTAQFGQPLFALFLLFAVGTLVLLRSRPAEEVLPTALFLMLGIMAIRNMPPAAVVAAPVLARGLPFRRPSTGGPALLNRVAVATLLAAGAVFVLHAVGSPAYDLRGYPVKEVAWMEANGVRLDRAAYPTMVGNYLEWRDDGRTQVFQDDRFDMFSPAFIAESTKLVSGVEGWDAVLDHHGIQTVLWPKSAPLAQLVSVDPRWKVVHRTKEWVIAVRAPA